jgi:hypothetical protein
VVGGKEGWSVRLLGNLAPKLGSADKPSSGGPSVRQSAPHPRRIRRFLLGNFGCGFELLRANCAPARHETERIRFKTMKRTESNRAERAPAL